MADQSGLYLYPQDLQNAMVVNDGRPFLHIYGNADGTAADPLNNTKWLRTVGGAFVWSDIAQADVTNLVSDLAGKAATSHTHTEANVTNLVSDLAGKAATSHTHAESDVNNLVSDLALKAPLASPALTGVPTVPTAALATNTTQAASTAFVIANAASGTDTTAVHYLVYDTTGVTSGHTALQAAIDAGYRNITIPAGTFKCGAAVFDDLITSEAGSTLTINAYGVRFEATTGLPTATSFESICTGYGFPTGCKWFFFSNTARTALSGGSVTTTGNFVTPTYNSRVPVNPRLVMRGATFSASGLTKYNAGFCFGNRGGAIKLEDCHMSSCRTLMSWEDYVDGHTMMNCSGWGIAVMDATYDAWMWFGGGSGDGVVISNVKVDNYIGHARMFYNNGANITSSIAGSFEFYNCHGVTIDNSHTEQNADITTTLRRAYYIKNSHVIINGNLDYTSDSLATTGLVYVDDDVSTEGSSSYVELRNFHCRDWITTSDPSGGWAIYINNMANATRIRCRSATQSISTTGDFFFAWGKMGLKITGNAANESSLAAALVQGRDLIASGDFDIVKYDTATAAAGQASVIPIVVRNIGNLSNLRQVRNHAIPTFYDTETSLNGTGTLSNGTTYGYCAALVNTLPDSTLQYGAATASSYDITAGASGVAGFELYMPSAAHGATVIIWRKTGAGVRSAPTRYVLIPVQSATSRFLDTGTNINKFPWITSSVPVPDTVAATNHTAEGLYLGTTAITVP